MKVDEIGSGIVTARGDETVPGWTVGAGFEQAFATNWSWKVEYNYLTFNDVRFRMACPICIPGTNPDLDVDQDIHVVKLGINYRF